MRAVATIAPREAAPVTKRRRLIGCVMFVACAVVASSANAAETFHVTSLADGGPGTLRSAIENAPFGEDATTIVFDVQGTINLTQPLFIVAKVINIEGPGAGNLVINGNRTFRVIWNIAGSITTISGVTIQNGRAIGNFSGGGIYNAATLTVNDCVIANNDSVNFGGGIYSDSNARLTVTGSIVSDNSGFEGGGGIHAVPNSTTFIANSTFARNSSAKGGGAVLGIFAHIEIVGSTFANNSAASGAGVQINNGLLHMINDTIFGNVATNIGGGLVINNGLAYVSHVTIASNTAVQAPSALAATQGLQLKSSVIANAGTGGNCVNFAFFFFSGGGNVFDDGTCSLNDSSGDKVGISAELDPFGLEDHGGVTATVALLATSPAIDAVPGAACTTYDGFPVVTDQRGVARPIGAGCDAGAFESPHIPTPSEQTAALIGKVEELLLPAGIQSSLTAKLESALETLDDRQPRRSDRTQQLYAFIHEVTAQRGKKLSGDQADALVAAAMNIIQKILQH